MAVGSRVNERESERKRIEREGGEAEEDWRREREERERQRRGRDKNVFLLFCASRKPQASSLYYKS